MRDEKSPSEKEPRVDASSNFHVIFGAGGSKAILGATGAIAAFELCGLKSWRTIGGVSGGSVPGSLYAGGVPAAEILRLSVDSDFMKFLIPRTGVLLRLWAFLSKYRYEITMPPQGVFTAEPLRQYINAQVPVWPTNFWTMVTTKEHESLVLTAAGVHCTWTSSGTRAQRAECGVDIGTAVNASCAIPGIVDAVWHNERFLFDGAVGDSNSCPVDPPQMLFGATPQQIIAIDVEEEIVKKNWLLRTLWHIRCGGSCGPIESSHPSESDGYMVIEPKIRGFHALQFELSEADKWRAILAGFSAAIARLAKAGLIPTDKLAEAMELSAFVDTLDLSSKKYRNKAVAAVRAKFTKHGLLP